MNVTQKLLFTLVILITSHTSAAEPIYHETYYPAESGPFPAVVALHSSGGYETVKHMIQRYVDDGFVVYAPNFFKKHGLFLQNRMKTFDEFRPQIEKELSEIVTVMKSDPQIQSNNVFAVGFSNGGYWASYLAATSQVNAAASHYGVWKANFGRKITNDYPMKYFSGSSNPVLALHGEDDHIQRLKHARVAWETIEETGAPLEIHVYPDADHAWDRQNHRKFIYNRNVDQDAHKRTVDFFKAHMN